MHLRHKLFLRLLNLQIIIVACNNNTSEKHSNEDAAPNIETTQQAQNECDLVNKDSVTTL